VLHLLSVERYIPEMCSGSEAGSCLNLLDFVYHSTLDLTVIKKKKKRRREHMLHLLACSAFRV